MPGRMSWAGQEKRAHPSGHPSGSTEGEVGRALPAPGTTPCPGRVGIISGICSHRPRLRLSPSWHRDESRLLVAGHPWQEAQHGQTTQYTPPHPPLWPLQVLHTPHQASPANHLPQSLFPARSSGAALLGTLGTASLLPIRLASPGIALASPAMASPSPAPPALPQAGEWLLEQHRPCRPCRLCWKPARWILRSWDRLERNPPLQYVPQNPRRAVLEAQHLCNSTRPQLKQGKNHTVMESQNCSGWKSPPRSQIPTASPALPGPPLNHASKCNSHMFFGDSTTALG